MLASAVSEWFVLAYMTVSFSFDVCTEEKEVYPLNNVGRLL
jgi:hypothetical protein